MVGNIINSDSNLHKRFWNFFKYSNIIRKELVTPILMSLHTPLSKDGIDTNSRFIKDQ